MTMLESALALAAMGFRVFPLMPNGKTPAIKGWQNRASSDPAKVREMWRDDLGEPGDFNIGVATGRGLLVLDFDVKDGQRGLEDFEDFRSRGLKFSSAVYTATGGVHVYLRLAEGTTLGNSAKKIAPATDTRCEGGYVVGPGSRIDSNIYYWISDAHPAAFHEFIEAADWLVDECDKQRQKDRPIEAQIELDTDAAAKRATAYLIDNAPRAIEGEGGNQTTYQVAARVKDFGVSEALALDLMLEHWNETKALPPWQPDDLERIVGNAYRYGTAIAGKLDARFEFDPCEIKAKAPSTQLPKSAAAEGLTFTPFREVADRGRAESARYLVKDIMDLNTLSMIYGASHSGKSFVALELARCIAMGADFAGHKTRQGTALYMAMEGEQGVGKRFAALALEKTAGQDIPLALVQGRFNLFGDDKSVLEIIYKAKAYQPAIIFIDTLVRASAGANENAVEDMNLVFDRAHRIMDALTTHVCLIHHTGKDKSKNARGSSAIYAALDTSIRIDSGEKTGRKIIFDKQRDGEMIPDIDFRLCKVRIGCDEELNDITSCVVDFRIVRQSAEEEASDALRTALSAFDIAAAASGPVVKTAAWLTALADIENKNGNNPPTQKSLEDRARRLIGMGVIEKAGRGKYRRPESRKASLRDSSSVQTIPQSPQDSASAKVAA